MAFIGGFLSNRFIKQLNSYPVIPQRDPRFAESQDIYVPPEGFVAAASTPKSGGGH